MRLDSRLSRMLHVLVHMADQETPMTSEDIAAMLQTNAAVVRRTLGHLRTEGYVTANKGHGGGWRLAKPLEQITLRDVYRALGEPRLFAIGMATDTPDCLVERAVNAALSETLAEADRLFQSRFSELTLAQIREAVLI